MQKLMIIQKNFHLFFYLSQALREEYCQIAKKTR